jgi:DNA repair exonuclease SbcCD nuclease subunit
MKLVLLSDLHVHPWQEFARTTKRGVNDRLLDCVSVLSDVRTYCEEQSIGTVVFGGDLFHKRGVVYTLPYNLVVAELVKFKESRIRFLCVDGNHDHADKAGTTHAIQALAAAGLVRMVPSRGWKNYAIDDLCVTLFSYCDNREEFITRVEAAERDWHQSTMVTTDRIGVFHHGFKGARVGAGLEYVVKEEIDGTTLNDYKFSSVFSGHYHARQSIAGLRRGSYIGSPLEHSRSDRGGDGKGFLVYDARKGTTKLVPLRRPRFLSFTQEELDLTTVEGHFVDVTYEAGSKEELERLLAKAGARGWRVQPLERPKKAVSVRLKVDPGLDPKALLEKYLRYKKADLKAQGLDQEETLNTGLDLLSKAHE